MLCLSGFQVYSRWVPLISDRLYPVAKSPDYFLPYFSWSWDPWWKCIYIQVAWILTPAT